MLLTGLFHLPILLLATKLSLEQIWPIFELTFFLRTSAKFVVLIFSGNLNPETFLRCFYETCSSISINLCIRNLNFFSTGTQGANLEEEIFLPCFCGFQCYLQCRSWNTCQITKETNYNSYIPWKVYILMLLMDLCTHSLLPRENVVEGEKGKICLKYVRCPTTYNLHCR